MMRGRRRAFLLIVLVASFGLAGCYEAHSDLSMQTLDEGTARSSLRESNVVVPEEFRFVGGLNQPSGFPGSPSSYVRFDGPMAVFESSGSLSAANPPFLPFHDVSCRAPVLSGIDELETLGMACAPTTEVRVSYRFDTSSDDKPMGPGSKALVLVADREVTLLYVIVEGT